MALKNYILKNLAPFKFPPVRKGDWVLLLPTLTEYLLNDTLQIRISYISKRSLTIKSQKTNPSETIHWTPLLAYFLKGLFCLNKADICCIANPYYAASAPNCPQAADISPPLLFLIKVVSCRFIRIC